MIIRNDREGNNYSQLVRQMKMRSILNAVEVTPHVSCLTHPIGGEVGHQSSLPDLNLPSSALSNSSEWYNFSFCKVINLDLNPQLKSGLKSGILSHDAL